MNKLMDLANSYIGSVRECRNVGEKLGEYLVNLLRPIIPDLQYSLGWAEGGIDMLCFHSKSHGEFGNDDYKDDLWIILEQEISEEINFDCPYGVRLSREEAEKASEIIGKALNE